MTREPPPADDVGPVAGYRRGSAGYRSLTLALFAAGMTTFAAMYAPQAVLPQLTTAFGVDAGAATLAVSATTGLLALTIIPASVLSERFGRTPVMTVSAVSSAVLGLLIPLSPTFELLVVGRALQGVALAGVPAVAMAYLAEEVDHGAIGAAMGRYIAGTTLGGLSGRLITGLALDVMHWRWALEVAAAAALAFTVIFIRSAPASRRFTPTRIAPRAVARNVLGHLRNPALAGLFVLAFLLMGGFVSIYNLVGFRLLGAPFGLPQALVSLVFCFYLAGTVTSATAGRLADRFGRGRVLLVAVVITGVGLVALLSGTLAVLLIGMLLFTGGFFAAHAVASGWVGRRATEHRAEASSMYLFGYYLGSAVIGAGAGVVFAAAGWGGAVGYVGGLLTFAAVIAIVLARLPPH
ncbi:MFS transporter [Nakamurella lactea]|uniref:MFS transporter n=1 Tax=Nakamurella lactea TaxID=459515 RepID=UPI00041A759D|nr:MFS transporter [Nakamurella lactea]